MVSAWAGFAGTDEMSSAADAVTTRATSGRASHRACISENGTSGGLVPDGHVPAAGQRQRDPSGTDAELQSPPTAGQFGEQVDRRLDGGRLEHLRGRLVVPRRNAFPEVPVVHGGDGTAD